jgi:hypothetical protein
VVGGYLNFSLLLRDVWGDNPKEDHLRGFFLSFLEDLHLVDMEPIKLSPTWRNFITGKEVVAKRLDKFLVSETMLATGIRLKSLVAKGGSWIIALFSDN